MFSYTNSPLEQSGNIKQVHQNSTADESEDMGKMIKDINPAAPPNTAPTEHAFLRAITDKRYNQKNRPEPTELSPIIVSTPASERRADAARLETHIKKLVDDLESPSLGIVREATSMRRVLSKAMDNSIVIAGCGAISPLVNFLRSSDQTTQEYAATTLLNLSINGNNKIAIAKADAIEPLIHVLRTGRKP